MSQSCDGQPKTPPNVTNSVLGITLAAPVSIPKQSSGHKITQSSNVTRQPTKKGWLFSQMAIAFYYI
jgi:hypothetical protein